MLKFQLSKKHFLIKAKFHENALRGGSRTAATSKMERFVIIVNGWKLGAVNFYHKVHSILDFAAVLDPLLFIFIKNVAQI